MKFEYANVKYGSIIFKNKKVIACSKCYRFFFGHPVFVHFTFSPMKISVTDFSAPIGASVFKFYVHLQVGKVYCVNEN